MATVIREHAFNTRWWGAPVGIIDPAAFVASDPATRIAALRAWAWAECATEAPTPTLREALMTAGFVHADTTIRFRLDLRRVTSTMSPGSTHIRHGTHVRALDLSNMRPFAHERFALLRDATPERVSARYQQWAEQLHRDTPSTVLVFESDRRPAGWFLSLPRGQQLDLALAMTASDGGLSGATLYREACVQYARDGFRIGEAGFSVRNLDVLNVYASLGARFTSVRECWLWQPTVA